MNKMKKFASIATAVLMTACMAAPMVNSFATVTTTTLEKGDTTSSITINNTVSGYTYKAYQIFSGNLVKTVDDKDTKDDTSDDVTTYGVLTEVEWGKDIDTGKISGIYAELKDLNILDANSKNIFAKGENNDEVLAKVSEVAESLAKLESNTVITSRKDVDKVADVIGKYLSSNNGTSFNFDGTKGYTATGLNPGYYLIQNEKSGENAGVPANNSYTRYIMRVAGAAEAEPKSDVPKAIKKVKENSTNTATVTKDNRMEEAGDITDNYNDVADYNIGDVVPFRLYGTLPDNLADYNVYKYTFHDNLGAEFDFVKEKDTDTVPKVTVKAKVGDTTYAIKANAGDVKTGYDVVVGTEGSCSFEVKFTDMTNLALYEINDGSVSDTEKDFDDAAEGIQKISFAELSNAIITVDYEAILNNNAVIGRPGQENTVKLEYSNNPNVDGDGSSADKPNETTETPEDTVIVFTYELDVDKVDGNTKQTDNSYKKHLKDAEFQLYKEVTEKESGAEVTNRYYYIGEPAASATDTNRWAKATRTTEVDGNVTYTAPENAKTLKSDENGLFQVKGIDEGTYYLVETKAPAGYNLLSGAIKLEIEAETENGQNNNVESDTVDGEDLTSVSLTINSNTANKITADSSTLAKDKDGIVTAVVENKEGSTLPSTGGIGTTLFYVGGGAMVAVAGVFLITKKRMGKKED